MLFIAFVMSR